MAGADAGRIQPGDAACRRSADGASVAATVRSVTPAPSIAQTRAADRGPDRRLAPGPEPRPAGPRPHPAEAARPPSPGVVVPDEAVQSIGGARRGVRAHPGRASAPRPSPSARAAAAGPRSRRGSSPASRSPPATPSSSRPSSARARWRRNDRPPPRPVGPRPLGRWCWSRPAWRAIGLLAARPPADRRGAGHHQQAGADQHRRRHPCRRWRWRSGSPSRWRRRLAGIPGLESTRSISRNGFSQVTAVFGETAATSTSPASRWPSAWPRPATPCRTGCSPQIGPVTTGLGEVFMYTVDFVPPHRRSRDRTAGLAGGRRLTSPRRASGWPIRSRRRAYLRTVQEWIIAPAAASPCRAWPAWTPSAATRSSTWSSPTR